LLELYQLILNTLSLYSCKRLNELYVNTIHDATCTYSASAMGWIYASLVIISFFSLLMITLRASWRDVLHEDFLKLKEESSEAGAAATIVPVSDEFKDEDEPQSNVVFAGISEDQSSKIDSALNTPVAFSPEDETSAVDSTSNYSITSPSGGQPLKNIPQSAIVPATCLSEEEPLENSSLKRSPAFISSEEKFIGAPNSLIASAHSEEKFPEEFPSSNTDLPNMEIPQSIPAFNPSSNEENAPQSIPVFNVSSNEENASKTDGGSNNPTTLAPSGEKSSKDSPLSNEEFGNNSRDVTLTTSIMPGLSEKQASKNDSTSNSSIDNVPSEEQSLNIIPNTTKVSFLDHGIRGRGSFSGSCCEKSHDQDDQVSRTYSFP